MKEKLLNQLNNSYSPYSKFRVAAIVVTTDDKEFLGTNVENASYGATICAERAAIISAVSNGVKKENFKELHLMCDSDKLSMPCFMCRQVISEFFKSDKKIYIYNNLLEMKVFKVEELCPYPFDENDLN